MRATQKWGSVLNRFRFRRCSAALPLYYSTTFGPTTSRPSVLWGAIPAGSSSAHLKRTVWVRCCTRGDASSGVMERR